MDPATEISTLVVSYLWPLHELCTGVTKVAEFTACEPELTAAARADYALISRLYDVANRSEEEGWLALEHRATPRTASAPSSEPAGSEDETALHPKLRTFWRHVQHLAAPGRFGELEIGGTTTRDGFARAVLLRLFKNGVMSAVARELDYVPIVVRRIAARATDLTAKDCESLLHVSREHGGYPTALIAKAREYAVPLPFGLVLHEELAEIEASRRVRGSDATTSVAAGPSVQRAYDMSLVGLAISGGGIRSATFALGVLQGLANRKWLQHVDYLSTVSGGGYIGSWLLAWIKRQGSMASVQESLSSPPSACRVSGPGQQPLPFSRPASGDNVPAPVVDPHAEHLRPLRQLREYSNYLTPMLGAFSSDTWTMFSIWARNTVLNLLVLTLVLIAGLLVPRLVAASLYRIGAGQAAACAAVLLLFAAGLIARNLRLIDAVRAPSGATPTWHTAEKGDEPGFVVFAIVLPSFLALLFAVQALTQLTPGAGTTVEFWSLSNNDGRVRFGALAILFGAIAIPAVAGRRYTVLTRRGAATRATALWRTVASIVSGGIAALLGAALIKELWEHLVPWLYLDSRRGTWFAMAFGPAVLVLVISATLVLFLGLEGRHAGDEKREWWSRFGGWMNLVSVAWAVGAVLDYFSPYLLATQNVHIRALGGGWAAITAAGTWLASSGKSNGINLPLDRKRGVSTLITIAPYVFVGGFFVAVSLLTHWLVYYVNTHFGDGPSVALPFTLVRYTQTYWANLDPSDRVPLYIALGTIAVAIVMAWRVDVNEFSMHHFYRNRLVRAYLGASRSRAHRKPNPFTGLDVRDDIPLWRFVQRDETSPGDEIADCRPAFAGPFPILNATLNLTSGDELAYQERKAQSFVFTPLYYGYDFASKQTLESEQLGSEFAFRPTSPSDYAAWELYESHLGGARRYWRAVKSAAKSWLRKIRDRALMRAPSVPARVQRSAHWTLEKFERRRRIVADMTAEGGISLGTAMAISGAAANPNAGHHSSPAVAFLLTVFNARLGWWLGNPRRERWTMPSPKIGLLYLLSELFGFSGINRAYVNLSDGAHFDNMGLYELIRRRCRFIIVCDGEQDEKYSFNGLAGAVRKCRIDFGAIIDISTDQLIPARRNASRKHVAVGSITYPGHGCGTLIYIKASMTGDEPPDVQEYHHRHEEFPHQPTADQFFDESQFESYRALGQHIADQAFPDWASENPGSRLLKLDRLFKAAAVAART